MINVGRQLKAGFRSVMQEQGQEVVIISHWNTPFQVIVRVKGVKSNKEGRPDYSVFQFTEAYSIENGSIIYVPKNDTYWRVYETEDRILGNVYVLFEAKTNKTWLELDEKEFEELIVGAKGPEGQTFDKKPTIAQPNSEPAPSPSEPQKEPSTKFSPINYTPPPTPPLPGLNKDLKSAKRSDQDSDEPLAKPEDRKQSRPESSPRSSPATQSEDTGTKITSSQPTSDLNKEKKSQSKTGTDVAVADEEQESTTRPGRETEARFLRGSSPKLPFRKRSDQLYVARQINSLVHSIPKAELEERMKSEAISALKTIEDLLVQEVTEKEKTAASKRLEVVIKALDHDLEFAVNVATHLPPIYTYFGLEIE